MPSRFLSTEDFSGRDVCPRVPRSSPLGLDPAAQNSSDATAGPTDEANIGPRITGRFRSRGHRVACQRCWRPGDDRWPRSLGFSIKRGRRAHDQRVLSRGPTTGRSDLRPGATPGVVRR